MRRRPSYRAIHTHLSYTVEELARATGVCKATVRRWLKAGLPAITDMRPALIVGADAITFLRRRGRPTRRCKLGEFFCFACREPRRPAFREAEIASRTIHTLNVRALCEACATTMHTRVSLKRIAQFCALVRLPDKQAEPHLSEREKACGNVHLSEAG